MSKSPSKFVWYELMTTDVAAAGEFLWRCGWLGHGGFRNARHGYTLLSVGPTQIGGMMALPEAAAKAGGRPGWTGYVGVADVDAGAVAFEKAGGVVHHAATDIPGIGRFAVVADPQGAVLTLFKGASGAEPSRSRRNARSHRLARAARR